MVSPSGKLDKSNAADRRFAAYEKQYLALETQVYSLEAENARLRARVKVLEVAKPGAALMAKTDAELEAAIEPLIKKMGYVKKKS